MVKKMDVGFILLGIGLLLAVTGMLSYTGLMALGIPNVVMYVGFLCSVFALMILYVDLKLSEEQVEEYLSGKSEAKQ